MTDDIQAAITAAREAIWDVGKRPGVMTVPEAVDRYGALVALAARWDEHAVVHRRDTPEKPMWCGRCPEIADAVRRLLPGDGPTEAHSARNDDQPSG